MKSALFVWGGWSGHEPKQTAVIFATCLQAEGYQTELTATLDVYRERANGLKFRIRTSSPKTGADWVLPIWRGRYTPEDHTALTETWHTTSSISCTPSTTLRAKDGISN